MASPATHTPNRFQFSAPDTDNHTQTSHHTNSTLTSLPREIRDEICAYLLNAGDLAILRTSKQLSHEAKELLYREGVCRVKLGFASGSDVDLFLSKELGRIQNYDIRVYFRPGSFSGFRHFFRNSKHSAGHGETRSRLECHVILEYDPFDFGPVLWINSSRALAAAIACLATFKKVVMVVRPTECKSLPRYLRDLLINHGRGAEIWSSLRKRLEPDLGPSKVIGGTHGVDEERMFRLVEFRSSRVDK